MATYFESDIPGGMMCVTVEVDVITADFHYPAAMGELQHVATGAPFTLEELCRCETVTVTYDDFDGEADAMVTFKDPATGKGYLWNVEHPGESRWIEPTPDSHRSLPWWLTTARNALRP